ncbi:MAG: dihydrolipoamide acetyltransferase family protein [Planctomycetota bacterium]|nr:dihydrolipoamide acetyltransferase family protein [Planctomycetota bacterium]
MVITQPADKSHFILPDLGEGVAEAELIRWKIKRGDQVQEHQTLAEMETDKALVEVPSPWSGVIKQLHGKEGDVIPVGSVLVTYETADGSTGAASAPQETGRPQSESADAGTVVGSVDTGLTVSDRLTRGRTGEQAVAVPAKALATPAVRRIAREQGADINQVPGTGRGGRVTAADVYAFAGGAGAGPVMASQPEAAPPLPAVRPDETGVVQRIPFRGIRRKIAQALERSVKTAVHFTVTDEADVTILDQRRAEYDVGPDSKLSFLPIVITAVCKALKHHPSVNANVDDEKQQILIKGVINLGCAVDTEHGLMVPVIRDADKLSLARLADAIADVARRCRDRTIGRKELIGGTFTITNVGSFGGMYATPIINYPEVAILAVGRVKERVLVKNGMFYAGKIMPLSLACDHRVVDGAEGARFLGTVVKCLEDPEALFARGQ